MDFSKFLDIYFCFISSRAYLINTAWYILAFNEIKSMYIGFWDLYVSKIPLLFLFTFLAHLNASRDERTYSVDVTEFYFWKEVSTTAYHQKISNRYISTLITLVFFFCYWLQQRQHFCSKARFYSIKEFMLIGKLLWKVYPFKIFNANYDSLDSSKQNSSQWNKTQNSNVCLHGIPFMTSFHLSHARMLVSLGCICSWLRINVITVNCTQFTIRIFKKR